MITVNLLFQLAVAAMGPFSSTGGVRNSGGFVPLLLNMHDYGYTLTAMVLCLSLVVLGHLAYQSAQLPTVISAVLIVNLITATLIKFLWPDVPTALHEACTPPAVVDLWLIAYLVIRGGIRVSPNIAAPKPDAASPRRGQPRSPSPSPDAASTE